MAPMCVSKINEIRQPWTARNYFIFPIFFFSSLYLIALIDRIPQALSGGGVG